MNDMQELFGEVMYAYTRKQAVEDGDQVLATGELAEFFKQYYKHPIYITSGVWELVQRAVNNKKHSNDWEGVWHDIMWMSQNYKIAAGKDYSVTRLTITGAGRKRVYDLMMKVGPTDIDDPRPAMTLMFPHED